MPTTFLLHLHLVWGMGFYPFIYLFFPLVMGFGGLGVPLALVCLLLLHLLCCCSIADPERVIHGENENDHGDDAWKCTGHREYLITGPDSCLHFRFISAIADEMPLPLFCCMHNISSFFFLFFYCGGGEEHQLSALPSPASGHIFIYSFNLRLSAA